MKDSILTPLLLLFEADGLRFMKVFGMRPDKNLLYCPGGSSQRVRNLLEHGKFSGCRILRRLDGLWFRLSDSPLAGGSSKSGLSVVSLSAMEMKLATVAEKKNMNVIDTFMAAAGIELVLFTLIPVPLFPIEMCHTRLKRKCTFRTFWLGKSKSLVKPRRVVDGKLHHTTAKHVSSVSRSKVVSKFHRREFEEGIT